MMAPAPTLRLEDTICMLCGSERRAVVARGRDYEYGTSSIAFSVVRCDDCGHVYLNPRPAIDCAAAIYPANYYARSGTQARGLLGRIKDGVTRGRIAKFVRGLPSGARVLDAGCGDGALLLAIRRQRRDLELIAVDLAFAPDRRSTLAAANIACIDGLLEQAPLPGGCALVIMNQLIEHLWDVDAALRNVHNALSRGGLLVVATPNLDGYDRRLFRHGDWGGYYFPRHLNLFTGETLADLIARRGFEVVDRRDLVAPLVWIGSLRNACARRGWRLARLFRDDNLAALTAGMAADVTMKAIGWRTSNQQLVARKP